MPDPELSVVVVAHQRREFVAAALASVRSQTLEPGRYETVLCTDLDESAWGGEHADGLVTIRPPPGRWGAWLLAALPTCRGRVICFLDDDDVFTARKLESVRDAFLRHPRLGYYHNRSVRIGPAEGSPDGSPPAGPSAPIGPSGGFLEGRRLTPARTERMFWAGAGFNASSMAVRRELIDPIRPLLGGLEVGHPLAFFYAAAMDSWDLYLDPEVLTHYRVHDGNSSVPAGAGLLRSWGRMLQVAPSIERDSERLADWIGASPQQRVSPAPLRAAAARQHLVRSIGEPDRPFGHRARSLAAFLGRNPPRVWWWHRGLAGLGLASLLVPHGVDGWLVGRAQGVPEGGS
jgi:glycosyl transferase family 2